MTQLFSAHPGHGPRWDPREKRWWWAAAGANAVHAFSPQTQTAHSCKLPDGAALLAHCRSGRLLLGLPKRLCLAQPGAASARPLRLQPLVAVDAAEPRTRISDGCTDRSGYLVFGTGYVGQDARQIGSFYQYSLKHGLRRLALPSVEEASSICFSADGKRLFFADARQGRILHCTYDAELGGVGAASVFAQLDAGLQPRGAALDAGGCLWSAQPGQLVQYAPDGRVLRHIAVDCAAPAFGGAQLAQLVVAGAQGLHALPAPLVAGQAEVLFDDYELS